MARKSAASLSVVSIAPKDARLSPPKMLTTRQKAIWRQVVAAKPADWFTLDAEAVLAAYVIAISHHEIIAARVEKALLPDTGIDDDAMDKLYRLLGFQAGLVHTLATKMRLTQQARYTTGSAATKAAKASGQRPWDK